jgi:hypothetical protein
LQLRLLQPSRAGRPFITLSSTVFLRYTGSNGPEIAFRGGRVDAVEPNKPGVPEPQQDLDSHIASFARQGFTKTEMIGLVACGSVLFCSKVSIVLFCLDTLLAAFNTNNFPTSCLN